MELQTARLSLQEVTLADVAAIHQLHSLPETDEFNTLGIPDRLETTQRLVGEWVAHQNATPRTSYTFVMRLRTTQAFGGLMALNLGKVNFRSAEVWYKIHPTHWRQGYTTEALTALLDFGFSTLSLHRIEAGCAVENSASIRVLEKVGMQREGRKRQILPIRGEWVDNYFYAILETDRK
ncbi:GNAT family N-acetyltransferase [Hymenobacter crusticola]|uniref:GNAT family N-acetyltransferase n=2 Tax=Hymenobacter crusticola TaxID=1770526 RepID=A0A243W840_9BACT|nr:GNAT family N-acetyltransferase [Hymenobacter crusticola]